MPATKPPEFRRQALDLVRLVEQPVVKIPKDLGISESCLRVRDGDPLGTQRWRPACCPVPTPAAPPEPARSTHRPAGSRSRPRTARRPCPTRPTPAEALAVQHLHLATIRGCNRPDRGKARSRAQPRQCVPIHPLRSAEIVDHLCRRHPGHRMPLAVRQFTYGHCGGRHHRPLPRHGGLSKPMARFGRTALAAVDSSRLRHLFTRSLD
jgi:hypothetical protein